MVESNGPPQGAQVILEDRHILMPEEVNAADMVEKIRLTLAGAKANKAVWADACMDWENFIFRACLEWGVNPGWVLMSFQRERSLLGQVADERDFDFAQGVVGQDGPGTVNKRWNGLPNQIFLSARTVGWLSGRGSNFGYRSGLQPSAQRWTGTYHRNTVRLYGTDNKPTADLHICKTVAEFVQLSFTPHLEVLETNGKIMRDWCPLFL